MLLVKVYVAHCQQHINNRDKITFKTYEVHLYVQVLNIYKDHNNCGLVAYHYSYKYLH